VAFAGGNTADVTPLVKALLGLSDNWGIHKAN